MRDTTATDEWDMQERRSFPRTGLELPVHLTIVADGREERAYGGNLNGTTHDMSRGGCAVITDHELAARTRCIARFPLAIGHGARNTVGAEVRRSQRCTDGTLLGLEFDTPLEALPIAAGSAKIEERPARPHTILVVEDQPGIRGLLSRYLAKRGFEVRTAADGEEAFGLLTQEVPDVMLLDLYLPRLNGHDLLRRMLDMEIAVELILTMSGCADTIDARESLRLGASDHLSKPIDVEHLHHAILLRLGTQTTV
ncbi:MAG: response regulator [Acidobacteriota bacterium]